MRRRRRDYACVASLGWKRPLAANLTGRLGSCVKYQDESKPKGKRSRQKSQKRWRPGRHPSRQRRRKKRWPPLPHPHPQTKTKSENQEGQIKPGRTDKIDKIDRDERSTHPHSQDPQHKTPRGQLTATEGAQLQHFVDY